MRYLCNKLVKRTVNKYKIRHWVMPTADCSLPETTKFNYLCDSEVFSVLCHDNHKDSHISV